MADYSDLITKYSKKYGVPEKLIRQLINVESSGNSKATSPTGPAGLMQVSTAVAKEAGYSKADMYDPEKNIDAGVRYLKNNLDAFKGNVPKALLGYNQGTGGAKQMLSGKIPMAQEGWNYIHNKKFSSEYLNKDANIPSPSQQQAPSTEDLLGFSTAGMNPNQDQGYDRASMMSSTQPQAQTAVQQPPQPPKELSDTDKYNMIASQIRGMFNNAAAYQNTSVNNIKRGMSVQWGQIASMKNAPALFGGFK